jgi:ABC-type nickel/cobalt efflux system permease component RcnA
MKGASGGVFDAAPTITSMARRYAWAAVAMGLLLVCPPTSAAHPLGNFSINHQTRVQISRDRIDLLYILDQAEIPTFQERRQSARETLRRKTREVQENLQLIVDGKRVALRPGRGRIAFPRGQGGLQTTRVELPIVHRARARNVEVRDATFLGRVGWTDIVAEPGRGTAVRTSVSSIDPTNRLRTYRGITLQDVTDQRVGRFAVAPGSGTLAGPRVAAERSPPPGPSPNDASDRTAEDGLAGLFEGASAGQGVFVLMLLAAFGWGALHALSPGHGKAMVAAYLVGTRGAPRHAVALGGIVTVTHTIGVFALGLVTLLLSQWILPEDLYPWLNLAAGLLIVAVGLSILASRVRWARAHRGPAPSPDAGHHHEHGHDHQHPHHHDPDPTWKGLAGMGISAGIIPCPSALVVLLAAISQHQVGLGLILITAFSLGLAATITALGLLVVQGRRVASAASTRLRVPPHVVAVLPALSTFVILGLGIVLTAKAVPDVV